MNDKRNHKSRKQSRLAHIESKCDRIIYELTTISRRLCSYDIDNVIERMHRNARRMRAEAYNESRVLRKMFHPKNKG